MLKSVASKLVTLSTFAVLASAIIASPASALNIANPKPAGCAFDSPQIALTSAGQVQGVGFCPSTTAVVQFNNLWNTSTSFNENVTVSANGTFTTPFVYSRPTRLSASAQVLVVAFDEPGGDWYHNDWVSNILTVPVGVAARLS